MAERVVLDYYNFHRQLVLDARRELGHEHRESAVADERHTLSIRICDLSSNGIGEPIGHGGQIAAQREDLTAANLDQTRGPRSNCPAVRENHRVVAEVFAELPSDDLRLHRLVGARAALLDLLPPVAHASLRLIEE